MANPRPLTRRQRLFVEEYLTCWNASEAARRSGYTGKADVIGARLLGVVSIKSLVDQRLKEKTMQANEVLERLSEQAQANIGDFVTISERPMIYKRKRKSEDDEELDEVESDEDPGPEYEPDNNGPKVQVVSIDWDELKRRGHLVKKITPTRYGYAIELHDAQAALVHMGSYHQLFTKKIDLTSGGKPLARTMTDDELAAIVVEEDSSAGTSE
ncbi:MAG TPA: terminase small subunit [Anaerolineaceae bacterium]|nr:terminase small subunit [Anaerolineaceae bacterium]